MAGRRPNFFVGLAVEAGPWFLGLPDAPPGVRAMGPGDLHITVAFLGPVDEDRARAAFKTHPVPRVPPAVTLSRLVALGANAMSLLLDPEGPAHPVAQAIAAVRDDLCDAASARREARPPRPHVTIARGPRAPAPAVDAWRAAHEHTLVGTQVALRSAALFTWSDQRDRPRDGRFGRPQPAQFVVVDEHALV